MTCTTVASMTEDRKPDPMEEESVRASSHSHEGENVTADAVSAGTPESAAATGTGPESIPASPGFGAALRQAREHAGMSAPELVARLHLHPRQLHALEAEDFSALPEVIYIRGYLRACARELGVDAGFWLADLDRKAHAAAVAAAATAAAAAAQSPDRVRVTHVVVPRPVGGRGFGARRLVVVAVVLAALFATLFFVLHRSRGGHRPHAAAIAPASPFAARAPATAATPASAPAAAVNSAPTPASTPASTPAPTPAPTPASTPGSSDPKTGSANEVGSSIAMAAAGSAAKPTLPAHAMSPSRRSHALTLLTTASVWIDVSDSQGRTLLSQVVPGGSVQTVNGAAPLHLIIGKASAVTAQYRGRAVDLRTYADDSDVARLTLE